MATPVLPSASFWSGTTLQIGPLPTNTFTTTICNLLPNTVYQYRSHIVIGGVSYYGNICQILTQPLSCNAPVVETGNAADITECTMMICNNKVTNCNNLAVTQYGVLYTQNPAYGLSCMLTHANYPSYVCSRSVSNNIANNVLYFTGTTCEITGLSPNTTTYYRAFAKNSAGYGYGSVGISQTLPMDIDTVMVCLHTTFVNSLSGSKGIVSTNPTLGAGQFITMDIASCHYLATCGTSVTKIYCKPNSATTYSRIYCYESTAAIPSVEQHKSITINCGDAICWEHYTTGDGGSYSTIKINSIISNSVGISPMISPNYYCDKVENATLGS